MPDKKKPSKEELSRGGFNPVPAETSEPKEQFGPLPTDAPARANDKKRRHKTQR